MSSLPDADRLTRGFFQRDPLLVARDLLGCTLAHRVGGVWRGGWIVETEAYLSQGDPASHSARGRTPGNASMFAEPGRLYVYPIHAKHCLNFVTESEAIGSAVLIRAVEPVWGLRQMQRVRGTVDDRRITSGPGMLCQAMGVQRDCDGVDALSSRQWRVMAGQDVRERIRSSPRIGIRQAAELPLRFFVDGNRYVSGLARLHSRPRRETLLPR
ncbi:DNA-3-methyladenine glycosylase [Allorhodopirellula solitaria]|uniref:Putative 3-methyladenine DNA glycosylase n=1 Tax=Allorhodopirellula solitaria TaxID=2527987 RepID=A0A5C5YIU0_9BACT|nr:DNA-3-methyladenine glycosylase [Allorhodopirellula solitaria]TWT74783.1 3-methyladenine DNA glycosylase [Allorhodopirellula solitaria]